MLPIRRIAYTPCCADTTLIIVVALAIAGLIIIVVIISVLVFVACRLSLYPYCCQLCLLIMTKNSLQLLVRTTRAKLHPRDITTQQYRVVT